MSSDLHQKSHVEERLDDIYSQMVHDEYVKNTKRMNEEHNTTGNDYTSEWWDIENKKRKKIRYYYENYSFKKLIIDFFLIIITSGLIIFFFIYRHKKHIEYRKRVENGEFREEDFKEDIDITRSEKKMLSFLIWIFKISIMRKYITQKCDI